MRSSENPSSASKWCIAFRLLKMWLQVLFRSSSGRHNKKPKLPTPKGHGPGSFYDLSD